MPELPDLQVYSANLNKALKGQKLESVSVFKKRKLNVTEKLLKDRLEGQKLSTVERDGKELHFRFDNGEVFGLHMMLRGKLIYFNEKNDHRFCILEMRFAGGRGLALSDYQGQAVATLNPAPKESPDALSKAVTVDFLRTRINGSRATIKNLLLDQRVIRGIGNAYADEILWEARISPFSVSNKIPEHAIRKLYKAIKPVLQDAARKIMKNHPGIIGGEVRDFMKIHHADRKRSPAGARVKINKTGQRKTYYTDEQKLFT